jgi:phage shock protein PspC (stress-responsive transcriptional regulator)
MEKVINITLGKVVFYIESDAYKKLSTYLESVQKHFHKDEAGEEILEDIESSLAEKFFKQKKKGAAITVDQVEKVIEELGRVEDFEDEEPTGKKKKSSDKTHSKSSDKTDHEDEELFERDEKESIPKKMYRDPYDKIIAGVSSGLGAYFGIDTVLVRLAFLISTIFGGLGVVIYIVFWIILPVARTKTQQLEMHGGRLTLKGIEKSVKEGVEKLKKKDLKEGKKKILDLLNQFFKLGGKLLIVLAEIIRIILGFSLTLVGVSSIFILSFVLTWVFSGAEIPFVVYQISDFISLQPGFSMLFLMALYGILFVPLFFFFLAGLSLLNKKSFITTTSLVLLLVIWFASLGYSSAIIFENQEQIEEKIIEINEIYGHDEVRQSLPELDLPSEESSEESSEENSSI